MTVLFAASIFGKEPQQVQTLDRELFKELQDALVDAFPNRSSLKMMLRRELNWKLDEIAAEDNLATTTFELLTFAESMGAINALIKAARATNPDNQRLRALREMPPSPASQTPQTPTEQRTKARSPLNVIILHASRDRRKAKDLEATLQVLVAAKKIAAPWREEAIQIGGVRKQEFDERWNQADIIVLLLSADFLAAHQAELDRTHQALERVSIIPVLLRPCGWEYTWLAEIQLLPRGSYGQVTPVSSMSEPAEAWQSVLEAVAAVTKARGL